MSLLQLLFSFIIISLATHVSADCTDNAVTSCGYELNNLNQPMNATEGCSKNCCLAIANTPTSCSSLSAFTTAHQLWQTINCNDFVCDSTCLDPLAPLGSDTGALNKAYKLCGVTTDPTQIDKTFACSNSCCNAMSSAYSACNTSKTYTVFNVALITFQLFSCDGGYSCLPPENKCFDSIGLITGTRGALNIALSACGLPFSINSLSDISSNTIAFNSSQACTQTCCDSMKLAQQTCNTTNSESTGYSIVDTFLTGYQLLTCQGGYTCYPNDKCWDNLGLVNAEYGAVNRAMKSCGLPLDVKSLTVDLNTIDVDLDMACAAGCCEGLRNAEAYCNSTSDDWQGYQTFKNLMYVYQAAKCFNFSCKPLECFDPVGLINSYIGAANRVMRFCGAPLDVKSVFSPTAFNTDLVCTTSCCAAINDSIPYCSGSTGYEVFLDGLYAFQAGYCRPTFLCRPNDECFDPLGLINYEIGALNRALGECGAPDSIRNINDIANGMKQLAVQSCNQTCCKYLDIAEERCGSNNAGLISFKAGLFVYQSAKCQDGFTCDKNIGCYDALGIINSDVAPLTKAMKQCGSTGDLKDLRMNPSLACTLDCCDEMATASSTSVCRGSEAFKSYESFLVTMQTLSCQNSFHCNVTQATYSIFGLPVAQSVIATSSLVLVGLVIILILIAVLCCKFAPCCKCCRKKVVEDRAYVQM